MAAKPTLTHTAVNSSDYYTGHGKSHRNQFVIYVAMISKRIYIFVKNHLRVGYHYLKSVKDLLHHEIEIPKNSISGDLKLTNVILFKDIDDTNLNGDAESDEKLFYQCQNLVRYELDTTHDDILNYLINHEDQIEFPLKIFTAL